MRASYLRDYLWDRGFAGGSWTKLALNHQLRFILRWNKNYHLLGSDGHKHEVWKISCGKRSREYHMIWDACRRCHRKTGVIAFPVHLPEDDRQLFLMVSHPGYGRKPWYLITTEFDPMGSRLQFLLIASLAYAFLLALLPNSDFLFALLSSYCHRTGKWSREISAQLYRLRFAISRLWLDLRPQSHPTIISG